VIAPSIDVDDVATRLGRLPIRLRAALARELDRLARNARLSVSIDTTAARVTATIRTAGVPPVSDISRARALARKQVIYRRGRDGHAEDATALHPLRRLRVLRASSASSAVSGSLLSIEREIRAGLETAARQALGE
jgi:hypothetical protein